MEGNDMNIKTELARMKKATLTKNKKNDVCAKFAFTEIESYDKFM